MELVVVIAILGVLAAMVAPGVFEFVHASQIQAYNVAQERIQKAVDAYHSDPSNQTFLGKRQYPIFGADKIHGILAQPDDNQTSETITTPGNPLGGSQGGTPIWVDDGNGIRDFPDEELLNDEDDVTKPGWHVAVVERGGTQYIIDSRDFFINFDRLVAKGYLEDIPASASPDNQAPGSNRILEGPYSWYVGKDGEVRSLLYSFPGSETTGFQDVFPSTSPPTGLPRPIISGKSTVNEGSEYTLELTPKQPGVSTVTSWEIDWGDGAIQVLIGHVPSVVHTYADGLNIYTIAAKATDEDGTIDSNRLEVKVNNVAPTIALSGATSVHEGVPYTLTLGAVTDPGSDTVSQFIVHWGDGISNIYTSAGAVTHVYADGVIFPTIIVDVVDEDASHLATGSLSLTINNVAPTIALSGATSVHEGVPYTLTLGAVTDPGSDTVSQFIVHWGDGTSDIYTSAGAVTHTYGFDHADGDTPTTITVDLVDEDGVHTGAGSLAITVKDVVPSPFLDSFGLQPSSNQDPGGVTLDQSTGSLELWVVDEKTQKVFRYDPETGTVLLLGTLTSGNCDSKGITTDGTSFWVLDIVDKIVYRYSLTGVFQDSFALTTPGDNLEGITTYGTSLWVLDKFTGVFRYSISSGTFLGDSFSLNPQNSHAGGITTDGTSLWVVDKDVDKVFRYTMTGSLLGSFSVAPATHPEGITTDGTNIWVVDTDTDKVYRFDVN